MMIYIMKYYQTVITMMIYNKILSNSDNNDDIYSEILSNSDNNDDI